MTETGGPAPTMPERTPFPDDPGRAQQEIAAKLTSARIPYPENEQCDHYCGRPAKYRVLDERGYEQAVCCQECAPRYATRFEDKDGNEYNP